MSRVSSKLVVVVFAIAGAACSPKSPNQASICTDTVPTPAACMTACDATPGAPNTCPAGFHCDPDSTCDALCTPSGNQCGDGYTCTSDGNCQSTGSGNIDPGPDASCPAVHFTPMRVTPSIELLLDRSGSMDTAFGTNGDTRFTALVTGLTGTGGAVIANQANAYFGVAMFASDEAPCLTLTGYTAPRAINNASAIASLITNHPPNGGNTPTASAVTQITADFALNPPPAGSPPIILLATDGEPNSCAGDTTGEPGDSIAAVGLAYAAGIKTYIIGLAGLETTYLQEIADAGTGVLSGATYYTADNPAQLTTAFDQIINGALSCDLTLTGMIDPSQAQSGTLTINGTTLTYGTDWTLDANGTTIHLLGAACTSFEASQNPMIDASFPCGSVIQ
jgi:von Willebrand factor type A domain